MKVFVSHSKNFNFKDELYKPIRESNLVSEPIYIDDHMIEANKKEIINVPTYFSK